MTTADGRCTDCIMHSKARWVQADCVYRYSRDHGADTHEVDGLPNFKHSFRPRDPSLKQLQLERGIYAPAETRHEDQTRRAVILLRSSPWKAGSEVTPWRDRFDSTSGEARYFGDNKFGSGDRPEERRGNRLLLDVAPLFTSSSRGTRSLAPPLAVFIGEAGTIDGRSSPKGFVRFAGIALLESHEVVRQHDNSGRAFDNLAFDLRMCPLDESAGRIDWNWIDDRRNPAIPASVANLRAPFAWRYWVETGELPVS